MSELQPLNIADDRTIEQIREDGDSHWADGRPYVSTRILTIGYTEENAQERIDAFLANPQAALIDIRYQPYSRFRPAFNKGALSSKYPNQYIWMPEFGNINYKPENREKGISLANPGVGMERMKRLLSDVYEHPMMLMCACKHYERCHRKVVYELIMAAIGNQQEESAQRVARVP